MLPLRKGRYSARLAATPQDIDHAQRLRHLCFVTHRGLVTGCNSAKDADTFDDHCQHMLVEDTATEALVCTYRLMPFASGAGITNSYSAQFYDLARLASFPAPMAEMGRFCIHPAYPDPDIARLAWGALTRFVDATGVAMLFGCSSFDGADASLHQDALALLKDKHLCPDAWSPGVKAAHSFPYAKALRAIQPDLKRALITMPSLLRSYLMLGGWVSDHAVIDTALNTLHVFTALQITAIPATRARLLRAIAG